MKDDINGEKISNEVWNIVAKTLVVAVISLKFYHMFLALGPDKKKARK